jgi:hypothetical protein
MPLRAVTLDELTIDDDAVVSGIGMYRRLKRHLKDARYTFQLADQGSELSWDRALFLNLTFWTPHEGADVLCEDHLAADVLAHVALHHLTGFQLAAAAAGQPPSAAALFFGESIASAFDLYLLGRLLDNAPESEFITSQLPIIADVAEQAGLTPGEFAALIDGVRRDPERAFEDLRSLLFDVSRALLGCDGTRSALDVLTRFSSQRFGALLHHFQLSNWILYARAYARPHPAQDVAVQALDQTLRAAPSSLAWIEAHWLPGAD